MRRWTGAADQWAGRNTTEGDVVSEEQNKQVVQRAYPDGMNRKDAASIEETFSRDYVCHFPAGQGEVRGIEDFKATLFAF